MRPAYGAAARWDVGRSVTGARPVPRSQQQRADGRRSEVRRRVRRMGLLPAGTAGGPQPERDRSLGRSSNERAEGGRRFGSAFGVWGCCPPGRRAVRNRSATGPSVAAATSGRKAVGGSEACPAYGAAARRDVGRSVTGARPVPRSQQQRAGGRRLEVRRRVRRVVLLPAGTSGGPKERRGAPRLSRRGTWRMLYSRLPATGGEADARGAAIRTMELATGPGQRR